MRTGCSRGRAARPAGVLILLVLGSVMSGVGAANPEPAPAGPSGRSASEFEPGRAQRVRALHDPCLQGEVRTCYTPGYAAHARQLQRFLRGELHYVRHELGVSVPLSLAVLDERQWPQVERQLPYPIPSVTDDPPVALVAANWAAARGFLPKPEGVSQAIRNEVSARGLSWQQATFQAGDLLSGHELGHAVVDIYGIVPGTHWLNELLANYVLLAYLAAQQPKQSWLIDVVQAGNQLDRTQPYVSLEDFEARYLQILEGDNESNNYGWYQGHFIQLVQQIYPVKGLAFLKEVRAAFPPGEAPRLQLGNDETLRRVEKIYPGVAAWAADLRAQRGSGR